ncbi:hypothetical protein [Lysobacter antibioticus]|uniref:hypothetical protein n=1 Tax=Lysobacter antibioticus TaxID=84531 RepID=UPI0021BD9F68|nr:hypothetical protein [Lysobacter antibioticus]
MDVPAVRGYGGHNPESFDDYYKRWPAELSNFPRCVVENWVHRHWQDFESLWLNRSIELFSFEQVSLGNSQVMEIEHTATWLKTLDCWSDGLFKNKARQETWLGKYMLENGTTPAPMIIAPDASGLKHPRGWPMHKNQLIEGHMRLAYLRGMIRRSHPTLKSAHIVWHVSMPSV